MLAYPIELNPDDNRTWLVTCPDFPELTSYSERSIEDAVKRARDALIAVVASRMGRNEAVPDPSPARNRIVVRLPLLVCLKVTLYRALRGQRISQVELAKRLGCDPRQVRRLLDPTHESRLELMERALDAAGIQVDATSIELRSQAKDIANDALIRRVHRYGAEIRSLQNVRRARSLLARSLRQGH